MPLSDIVAISVSATGNQPTREGFGEPLIASYHTVFANRVNEYGSLAELVADGFATSSPTYKCATKIFAQNPRPKAVKVGRRALPFTQVTKLTCLSATAGVVYDFSVGGVAFTYTVPGSATTTTVATAIEALIAAASIAGLTPTTSGADITLTSASGVLIDVLPDTVYMTVADQTSDPGIATDLAAIQAEDNDWYCILLDSQGKAEIEAAAAWAEASDPKKLFLYNTTDSDCTTSATTDVMSVLKSSSYTHSGGLFSGTQLLSYSAAAWAGKMLPQAPGSENWDFKTLATVPTDKLSTAQIHHIENKHGSVYVTQSGLNVTLSGNGVTASAGNTASGEWLDVIRGIDWIQNEISVSIFGVLANNQKIPFTDPGIAIIESTIAGVIQEGIDVGFIAALPKYTISTPTAASVDTIDKANRNLPNVAFNAPLAGAINSVAIVGTVTD